MDGGRRDVEHHSLKSIELLSLWGKGNSYISKYVLKHLITFRNESWVNLNHTSYLVDNLDDLLRQLLLAVVTKRAAWTAVPVTVQCNINEPFDLHARLYFLMEQERKWGGANDGEIWIRLRGSGIQRKSFFDWMNHWPMLSAHDSNFEKLNWQMSNNSWKLNHLMSLFKDNVVSFH